MHVTLMKGKIHRASVTQADLQYDGSISLDRELMDAAGFLANVEHSAGRVQKLIPG
ncbi:aspartate 1-decarboxylase [Bradyrhizobium cytisi]|uniref:Aspartate 1-decarboxylase n=1 Tax=Bradyrhizobium cytisi TaxID=515489 RepID=A0A5S4VTE0_9BRAD|nr:aspartate 1-decarboxylase [Bradyrhizobium cytisi]